MRVGIRSAPQKKSTVQAGGPAHSARAPTYADALLQFCTDATMQSSNGESVVNSAPASNLLPSFSSITDCKDPRNNVASFAVATSRSPHSNVDSFPSPTSFSSTSATIADLHRYSDVASATSFESSLTIPASSSSLSLTSSTMTGLHRHTNATPDISPFSSSAVVYSSTSSASIITDRHLHSNVFTSSFSSSSVTSLHAPRASSSARSSHSLDVASSTFVTERHDLPSNVDSFASTEFHDSPSNVAPCTSFPYITDIHEPSFQNVLRASQCTNGDESARLSSNNFNDPFVTRRNDGHNPLPLSTAGYNSTDSGTIGLPWHPSFKTTRDMLKRRPANAIKMTYMSAKEKVDPEIDSGDQLAMITLQSAQRMNRRASVSSSSSSNCKPVVRSHGRKWIYEVSTVTHEEQLKDIVRNLENWKKKWENDGNYLQAAAVAKQLQALKIFLENKRRIIMREAHCKEKEDAESAYKAEINEKNKLWRGRFKVFQDEVIQHAQFLKQQHAIALQIFRDKMETGTPKKPQFSRDLLNERKVQTCLGKQGKYLEAQTVKSHADHKEFKELQATLDAYQSEVAVKERLLKAKQQSEMSILLQRASQTRDELKKNKENEIACCIQHHKHVLRDLEVLHKQERLKFERRMKKIIQEFRAVGGEMRDLSHAMEKLVIPVVAGGEELTSSSKLEIEALNMGGLSRGCD